MTATATERKKRSRLCRCFESQILNESNPNLTYGRQFDATNNLYSTLTRASIDALKANFKEKLETEDWRLVVKLKKVFNII